MCVIAYVPSNAVISDETIQTMFKNNPDGAGLMWKPLDGSPVQILKGFMKLEELLEAFHRIPSQCEKAIHCRIATSGAISTATCHPFPVRSSVDTMRKCQDQTSMALMHNGIISYCTPKGGMKARHSDTMEFAQDILFPLRNQLDKFPIRTLLEESTNSRLLIFRQYGGTIKLGKWEEENGVYYSNQTYKASRTIYPKTCYLPPNHWGYGTGNNSCWGDTLYDTNGYFTYELESRLEYESKEPLTDDDMQVLLNNFELAVQDELGMNGCEVIDVIGEYDEMCFYICVQFRSYEYNYSPKTIGGTKVVHCDLITDNDQATQERTNENWCVQRAV